MGSGKTWAAEYLVNNKGYTKLSLAGKLKAIAYEMYGIQGKDGNDRLVLQGLGTDLRKYDENVWIKYLLSTVKHRETESKYAKFAVDDVRYINEANVLRKNGFIIIRIVTDSKLIEARLTRLYPNRPATAILHASETEQIDIREDYALDNDEYLATLNLDNLLEQIYA